MYPVKDHVKRAIELRNGITLQACGSTEHGYVCAVDVILHGNLMFCLSIQDESGYSKALAMIFDALTPENA